MKKPIFTVFLIIGLLLVNGCYFIVPNHDTKPRTAYQADRAECEKQARLVMWGSSEDRYDLTDEIYFIQNCVREKGWKFTK